LERHFHEKEAAGMQWLRKSAPDLVVVSQGGNLDGLEWMSNCNKAALPYVSIVQCNHEGWWIEDNLAISAAKAYQNAKKVYCVSNHNLELLEYQIGESLPQAKVVWNPFNISTTQPPAWPEMKGTCKLACVARLDPAAKGHDVLFEVLALPEWRSRNIELNLYGKGKHEQVLRKLATKLKLNNVYFRGHVSNINEIWGENHLLVLASRFEGLPLALVETMYCERPAVVTDIGGNAELCVENETGFIANAPKAVLFAQAMERAWDRRDAWQTMGKTARKRIEGLVPKDPVADFCKDLVNCAGKNRS
jgi:glycosyltransferase involved in cell wall biosynthesis